MPISTTAAPAVDAFAAQVKALWEDPALTLERALEVRAQGGPPAGGPPQAGPNLGFIGPLNTSGDSGQCK